MSIELASQTGYTIRLPAFEGPLDLLLHLIREHKVEVYDIPIAQVTEQYLHYLSLMESLDLNIAGEFFVMAATLLEIKSRMLLPAAPADAEDEESLDPREELIQRLLKYETFKNAAEALKSREDDRQKVFWRINDELQDYGGSVIPLNLQAIDLVFALQQMLSEVDEEQVEVTSIERQKISLRMKMREVWSKVRAATESGKKLGFRDLLATPFQRSEVIITFLALLELLRIRRIRIGQKKPLGDINITAVLDANRDAAKVSPLPRVGGEGKGEGADAAYLPNSSNNGDRH